MSRRSSPRSVSYPCGRLRGFERKRTRCASWESRAEEWWLNSNGQAQQGQCRGQPEVTGASGGRLLLTTDKDCKGHGYQWWCVAKDIHLRARRRGHIIGGGWEYALNAVNQGITALGIKATNGIVLATEKKSSSPLADQSSVSKISNITPNIGTVYSGMGPDSRVLVDRARKVSHTGYKRVYNEYPPTRILVQDVARVMQEATQSAGVRPYGVSMLIAGWDDGIEPEEEETSGDGEKKPSKKTGGIQKGGPMLYQVDPTGSYFPWKATAIGKSATKAKTFLEKRYSEELELEDAIHIALLTLKDNIEGEMNGDSIEIGKRISYFMIGNVGADHETGIVGPPAEHLLGMEGVEGLSGPRFRKLTPQEIEDYLTSL
ncbi:proteasome subunit alpha type 2 [Purpureocillium lavendulum]|uniref:Proteasome subunit alpha type 2 n=1 Tax=Purpureocillium lavendulum TaxID=1247861 RepID=A0AB34FQW2_9HYPO|nr:proteasome subunit alpha type 2 [Purpureocillium lavendulum]